MSGRDMRKLRKELKKYMYIWYINESSMLQLQNVEVEHTVESENNMARVCAREKRRYKNV